ncbi:MAG: ATP-grasp domain-containing protein [Oligoflexia bacterium]|nr:ATP-grasp domain-containing protein [Oligoflexia bacterium]
MVKKISKLLIANRGEVAARIAYSAKKMEMKVVMVYSEEDRDLPYLLSGDQLVSLGDGTLQDTYLDRDKILGIARRLGVNAIHPGYGFLAEDAAFVRAVEEEAIFVGPTADCMQLLGDKVQAKSLARSLGIPVIPQFEVPGDFPVIIKATLGGGGVGQRVVFNQAEWEQARAQVQSEGERAVGCGKLFVEKYLPKVRHLEVQIIGDVYGNYLHLFERECSLQRRRQKMVEEAPSPYLSTRPELRTKLVQAALALAQASRYRGVGTVEFLVDEFDNYYFMEVNPRLQVEHAVTEMILDIDLVEWQLRIAAGEPLPWSEGDIERRRRGHALEVRLYAEDPRNNFMPSVGTLEYLRLRGAVAGRADVRVESAYVSGNQIGISYDPMIAKIITKGENREQARHNLVRILDDSLCRGVTTNIDYLQAILAHPAFIRADLFTNFIECYHQELVVMGDSGNEFEDAATLAAAIAAGFFLNDSSRDSRYSREYSDKRGDKRGDELSGFRNV